MVFNQRTLPVYEELRQIVASGKYGALKRVNWVVTDWFRPNSYYKAGAWKSTWKYDGGGVLLNQCPHNLDLLQWICGMPVKVSGFCHEGHFHNIEVEDDVTAYLEWENGATGTIIASTGDAPGVNRLEITLDEAMIVCENGNLRIGEIRQDIGCSLKEHLETSTEYFRNIKTNWTELSFSKPEAPYSIVLNRFVDECLGRGQSIASGEEGRNSLLISNAIYLSSWEHRMIDLPQKGSEAERTFEALYEDWLSKKIGD